MFVKFFKMNHKITFYEISLSSSAICCPTCVIVRCATGSKLWQPSLTTLCISCRRTNASATTKSCKHSTCQPLLLPAKRRSSAHLHRSRLNGLRLNYGVIFLWAVANVFPTHKLFLGGLPRCRTCRIFLPYLFFLSLWETFSIWYLLTGWHSTSVL